MKKLLSFLLILVLALGLTVSSFAVYTNYWIDNDTSDTDNAYNIREGYTAYITDSDYQNGDLRRTTADQTGDSYCWMRRTTFSNTIKNNVIHVSVGVYLKSSVLTDTAASYWCMQADGAYRMFTMDQQLNATGWTYHSYTVDTNYATPGWFSIEGVMVRPSGIGSGYSAADAIYIDAFSAST